MSDILYLACPYTHADPEVRRLRAALVNRLAGELIAGGLVVYSPISHSHAITEAGLPVEWDFWARQSLAMLAVCRGVLVYCLEGFEQSVGLRAEIEAATAAGKPVQYFYPEAETVAGGKTIYGPPLWRAVSRLAGESSARLAQQCVEESNPADGKSD
jgi:hypothetical protein